MAEGEKEIIVIDNGSTDHSRRFLYKEMMVKGIKFFDFYLNKGLSVASNKGVSMAKGEYLLFLNNDTKIDKYMLVELLKVSKQFDILGSKMLNYNGTVELDSALSVDRFGYPCGKSGNVFYPDGAIFIKKSLFDKIGGFDEKMFLYGEDRDLCWRALLMGHFCGFSNDSVFYHDSSSVGNNQMDKKHSFATNSFRRKISERNIIRSMLKNYSTKSLMLLLPQYIFWSILELLFLTLIGRGGLIIKAYIPAYWWNMRNFKDTIKHRKKIQATREFNDGIVRCVMSKEIGKLFVLKTMGIPVITERGR